VRFPLIITTVALACAVAALADDPPRQNQAPTELRQTLPNGLETVVMPSARAKWCVVLAGFRAGARDEDPENAGCAQLAARLLRKAACGLRDAGAADRELAALGPRGEDATPTGADAFHELTYTWATVPEEKLGVALDVMRDRLTALHPTEAVLEEERQALLSEPVKRETRAWNVLISLAFPGCSLGRPRLGNAATVTSLSLAQVDAWRAAHLRVDNAVFVIAGPKNAQAALDLVAEKLGKVEKPASPLAAAPPVPAGTKGLGRGKIDGPAGSRHVWIALRGPEPGSDDEAVFLAATFALKDRISTALQGKAHEATVRADARSGAPALLVVSATPRPAAQLLDVEAGARGAVERVRTEAPPEMEKLKARVLRMLDGLTGSLDARLVGARDEAGALLDAVLDRALAAPLVARREALSKKVAALTTETFLARSKELLSEDRMTIVTIEPPAPPK